MKSYIVGKNAYDGRLIIYSSKEQAEAHGTVYVEVEAGSAQHAKELAMEMLTQKEGEYE